MNHQSIPTATGLIIWLAPDCPLTENGPGMVIAPTAVEGIDWGKDFTSPPLKATIRRQHPEQQWIGPSMGTLFAYNDHQVLVWVGQTCPLLRQNEEVHISPDARPGIDWGFLQTVNQPADWGTAIYPAEREEWKIGSYLKQNWDSN